MLSKKFSIILLCLLWGTKLFALYDPGAGNTLLFIGQNYKSEYTGYINGTGTAPAGVSVYGELYTGLLNPESQELIGYLESSYPQSYVLVGLSWKDNKYNYGYTDYNTVRILTDITSGKFDSQIDRFSAYMKSRPSLKFMVRIDYEVSNLFHANTNPSQWDMDSQDFTRYPQAFNYIARRIREINGVSNAAFIYHPVRGQARQLYPGDGYVDWIAFSVFNHDVCLKTMESGGYFENCPESMALDDNLKNDLLWGAAGKPVMIAESGVQNDADKTASGFIKYLTRLFNIVKSYDVRALTYINSDWKSHGWVYAFDCDSRVETKLEVLNFWNTETRTSRYRHYTAGSQPTILPVNQRGDVNGDGKIDIVDALMTARHYVGLSPNGFLSAGADVNGDGAITIIDALMIAQFYVGLITEFTTATPGQTPTPQATPTPTSAVTPPPGNFVRGKYTPPDGKTLLIMGQDLKSAWDYTQSGYFPAPGGITTYLSIFNLDGLGPQDTDWGSGPVNATSAVNGYPNSVTVMGLYMTEEFYPGGLNAISGGNYDSQIRELANFIKQANRPFYLRIGYEFDGKWNIGYEKYEEYKSAFRHIVDVIRPIAPNMVSVWQSCTSPIDDILEGYTENIANWYPGDNYVDWCGLSWFLPSSKQDQLTNEMLSLARAHNKPVMIAESTPQGYDLANLTKRYLSYVYDGPAGEGLVQKSAEQIWSEWFAPYFDYIHRNSDVIRGVAYINCLWDSQAKWGPPYAEGYWGDTRVEANSTIRMKWLEEIEKPLWLHGSAALFNSPGNQLGY